VAFLGGHPEELSSSCWRRSTPLISDPAPARASHWLTSSETGSSAVSPNAAGAGSNVLALDLQLRRVASGPLIG
jgi:hypothetical protein